MKQTLNAKCWLTKLHVWCLGDVITYSEISIMYKYKLFLKIYMHVEFIL